MDFISSPYLCSSTQQSVCKNNSPLRGPRWMMCFAHTVKRHLMVRVWLELSNSASSWNLCWIPPTALKPWNLLAPAGFSCRRTVLSHMVNTQLQLTPTKTQPTEQNPLGTPVFYISKLAVMMLFYIDGNYITRSTSAHTSRESFLCYFFCNKMLWPFNGIISFLLNKQFGCTIFGDIL